MGSDLQLDLLEDSPVTLATDEEGGIVYAPGFLAPADTEAAFAALREQVAWRSDRRRMYDRDVDVPRLLGHFRLDVPAAMPAALQEIAQRVRDTLRVPFNSVGLNFYRDASDSVAPHHDHLYELVPGHPIALVSLGGPRRMQIRRKEGPRRTMNVLLAPGSLLTMSYASQLEWLHGIPKEKAPQPPRISLAFRVKPRERLTSEY
jgi:alkylated DNA repair dioxygenase AlkB